MKRQEFIEKYKNTAIIVGNTRGLVGNAKLIARGRAQECFKVCQECDLEALHDQEEHNLDANLLVHIFPKRQTESVMTYAKFEYSEFVEDHASVLADEADTASFGIRSLLDEMGIKSETVKEIKDGALHDLKLYFVQVITTQTASLWVSPNGLRILLIFGKGYYELSKQSY